MNHQIFSFNYARTYTGRGPSGSAGLGGHDHGFRLRRARGRFRRSLQAQTGSDYLGGSARSMGAHKMVHIRKITQLDSVRNRWKETPQPPAQRTRRGG